MALGHPVIYLHIGAMKTGTTFLQQLMIANQDELASSGYLFPGSRWNEQDRAARDVLGMARRDPPMRALCDGMWEKLAGQMLDFTGHASIFSMEFLSFASAKQACKVVSSLEGADVHVILTVRDAVTALPAQWQTHSRNGGTVSWPTFARGTLWGARFGRLARGQGARVFEMTQGIPRMLDAWGRAVTPGRLHVVTVPPSGSDPILLWERFAHVVGIDPTVGSAEARKTNPSLGQPSADLMRRINARVGKLPPSQYQPTLKAQLATKILTERSSIEPGAALDLRTRTFALGWNLRVREAIESCDAHVVGDLADLPVEPQSAAPGVERLEDPTAEETLAAAGTARDGLARLIRKRTTRVEKLGIHPDQIAHGAEADDAPTTPNRWRDAPDPVEAAVTELASMVRLAIDLHRKIVSTKTNSP